MLKLSRSGEGGRAGSVLPVLLSGLGGSYLVMMFLKLASLTGLNEVPRDYEPWWGGLFLLLLAAAAGGAIGHALFGAAAAPLTARLGKTCSSRDLRTVWGVASFPAALAFALILVLDLLIAGREAYAGLDGDSMITGWAVASAVIGVSFGGWSLFLFVKGVEVAGGLAPSRAIIMVVVATLSLVPGALLGFVAVAGVTALVGVLIDLVQAVNK
ncbi:MAG: hypothetical protein M3198_07510 [Actinomycetota bacterium]|nr:hypothetical protein [Actinomycetota bacterium]